MLSTPLLPSAALHQRLSTLDGAIVSSQDRAEALDRFSNTGSGRQKIGRFWRIDLDAIAPDAAGIAADGLTVRIDNRNVRAIACELADAARDRGALLQRAFGATSAHATKYGALAHAFAGRGAFVYVPADAACDEPIEITYTVAPGSAVFPSTVVLLERGARATVVERVEGGSGAFVCGVTEVVTEDDADLTYAAYQTLSDDARFFGVRAARPGRGARFRWADAQLGAALSVCDLSVEIDKPGVEAHITSLFFPAGTQHVDVVSTVDHRVGDSSSQTLVKSAGVGRGQARYLGNIRIAAHAGGSNASLRDDALLLSEHANIDSVPALEIGANDVKAYHGATVGAIDQEQIFYMESRGIERSSAERMIALGFFEPAIEQFPGDALRAELRSALAAKFA